MISIGNYFRDLERAADETTIAIRLVCTACAAPQPPGAMATQPRTTPAATADASAASVRATPTRRAERGRARQRSAGA